MNIYIVTFSSNDFIFAYSPSSRALEYSGGNTKNCVVF